MRQLLFSMLIALSAISSAQIIDVNPNIKWEYVRSQEITLNSGRTYQFEFPGENGYDYKFNLTHENVYAYASLSVFDLQYQPVSGIVDSSNNETMDLSFRVSDDGTYIVMVVLSDGQVDAKLPTTITLIRRPIVQY
ncbi:MAG: hypothetical protein JXR19_09705 [Bacteroidia bacterium]